ncbi:MAG: pyridoxine 5'-phosphate synthase [Deltaproteobacteria bacterium]|nr:pyridoxine 5'-phosphate synthase [Deltaproteobacteria bacterium]
MRLGVNIDHVATLREVRKAAYPDPVQAAFLAEEAGADQITVHLREDRRHIQERDLELLRQTVRTKLNLEMAATQEMLNVALEVKPDTVTLVPERREELTTEGGLDVVQRKESITSIVRLLHDADITVMLFIDPDLDQVRAAHKADASGIELHTGKYAEAHSGAQQAREIERLAESIQLAKKLGLGIAAGHGLHYQNVAPLLRFPELEELNIGHAIVARAVMTGMKDAVRDMVRALER